MCVCVCRGFSFMRRSTATRTHINKDTLIHTHTSQENKRICTQKKLPYVSSINLDCGAVCATIFFFQIVVKMDMFNI